MKIHQLTAIIVTLLITGISCDDSSTSSSSEKGSIEVQLTDAPAVYDSVHVDIQRVEVNNQSDTTGWITISEPNQRYNLLELTNGAYEVLGEQDLETGVYSQIRLILGDNNSVTVNGETHQLTVPSGSQTGLKLNIDAEIAEGFTYVLLLDFDASRSIVERGNSGKGFLLKPVIKAVNRAITGSIRGNVRTIAAQPVIYAIRDTDTLSTTFADTTDGQFRLIGITEGEVDLSFVSRSEQFRDTTLNQIEVFVSQNTIVEPIDMPVND